MVQAIVPYSRKPVILLIRRGRVRADDAFSQRDALVVTGELATAVTPGAENQ